MASIINKYASSNEERVPEPVKGVTTKVTNSRAMQIESSKESRSTTPAQPEKTIDSFFKKGKESSTTNNYSSNSKKTKSICLINKNTKILKKIMQITFKAKATVLAQAIIVILVEI